MFSPLFHLLRVNFNENKSEIMFAHDTLNEFNGSYVPTRNMASEPSKKLRVIN
jgi:hypothetical protein